jgi:hypothetical protein
VLIYGTNQLIGWENNNYNIYVPKSDYIGTPETTGTTGLFRTINQLGGNAFATFAHPSFSDFNNLTGIAYNATADSAVVGMVIASILHLVQILLIQILLPLFHTLIFTLEC